MVLNRLRGLPLLHIRILWTQACFTIPVDTHLPHTIMEVIHTFNFGPYDIVCLVVFHNDNALYFASAYMLFMFLGCNVGFNGSLVNDWDWYGSSNGVEMAPVSSRLIESYMLYMFSLTLFLYRSYMALLLIICERNWEKVTIPLIIIQLTNIKFLIGILINNTIFHGNSNV